MPTESRGWQLTPLQVPGLSGPLEIPARGLTLGRDPACDIVVPGDVFPGVSSTHARLVLDDDGPSIADLGSRNGLLVNGRPTDRQHALASGDLIELGTGGPRFVITSASGVDETLVMPRGGTARGGDRRDGGRDGLDDGFDDGPGTQTVAVLRERLGLPDQDLDEVLERRQRRSFLVALGLVVIGLLGTWWALEEFKDSERAVREASLAALSAQWEAQQRTLDEAIAGWNSEKQLLEQERDRLQATIDGQLAADEADDAELAALRAQLDETLSSLSLYDPVNLEQTRLAEVSRVERAVVLIEAVQTLRDERTGRLLFIDADQRTGYTSLNLEGRGEVVAAEGSGSGFCVSPDGWILTNAHVVLEKARGLELDLGAGFDLVPETELSVVFSGEELRRPARLVDFVAEGVQDLALIKIEPFEGMPHLDDFDPGWSQPARGSDVFLIGFPLGTEALQEGDRVIASAFRGIVSRQVGSYLQVDAAVHPGNSGGPVIDGTGHVIGVVTGRQPLREGGATASIGYVIPVSETRALWPPKPGGP